jgi:hypothetical protein
MIAAGFARSVDDGSLLHLCTQPTNKTMKKKTSSKKKKAGKKLQTLSFTLLDVHYDE